MTQRRPRIPIPSAPTPRWSLQTRLVIAFTVVVALALVIGGVSAALQLEGYFRDQERADLDGRATAALSVVVSRIQAATAGGQRPIIDPSGTPSAAVDDALGAQEGFLGDVADLIAQGDLAVTLERQTGADTYVEAVSRLASPSRPCSPTPGTRGRPEPRRTCWCG